MVDICGVLGHLGVKLGDCLLADLDLATLSLMGCDLAFFAGRGGESGDTKPS